jgi:hypothetical protein
MFLDLVLLIHSHNNLHINIVPFIIIAKPNIQVLDFHQVAHIKQVIVITKQYILEFIIIAKQYILEFIIIAKQDILEFILQFIVVTKLNIVLLYIHLIVAN